jgi:hypothetical protein
MDKLILSNCGYATELAQPYQIAQLCVFWDSDMVSYINGQCLPIDFNEEEIKALKPKNIPRILKRYNDRFIQNIIDGFRREKHPPASLTKNVRGKEEPITYDKETL